MITKLKRNTCFPEAFRRTMIAHWPLLIALVLGSVLAVQPAGVNAAPAAPPIAVPDDRLNQIPGVPVVVEV